MLNKVSALRLGYPVICSLWLAIGAGQGKGNGMAIFHTKDFSQSFNDPTVTVQMWKNLMGNKN